MKLTRDDQEIGNEAGDLLETLKTSVQEIVKEALEKEFKRVGGSGSEAVAIDLKVAEEDDDEDDIIKTRIGPPDDEQLQQIIKLTNVETTADQWIVAGIHASNNLLDRSSRRWSVEALKFMGADFVGKPLITDHSWSSVDTAKGICISSALVVDHASSVHPEMLSGAGEEIFNKEIIEKEGLIWLYLCVAVPRSSEASTAIENRIYQNVSTGSILLDAFLRCPNCERESNGKHVRMDTYTIDPKTKERVYDCPHLVGGKFMQQILGENYQNYNFSDYSILSCLGMSSVEISACQAGCLPKAAFIRG